MDIVKVEFCIKLIYFFRQTSIKIKVTKVKDRNKFSLKQKTFDYTEKRPQKIGKRNRKTSNSMEMYLKINKRQIQ